MRRVIVLMLLAALLAGCVRPSAGLPQATPEEVGLVWRECEVSGYDLPQAEACLGTPWPELGEMEKARHGTRTTSGLHLALDGDVYETRHLGLGVIPAWPWDPYLLLKNGRPVSLLFGEFQTYDPDRSLQGIAGRTAWEFADPRQATVIYDGRDLRRVYGLEAAYAPYELGGRLAFIGKRAGQYFLVYDGRQVGPAFDDVSIAYCCEIMLYSARGGGGHYRFWGQREGRQVVVEVEPADGEFAICLGDECTQEPFLSVDDIVSYDRETHEMVLTPAAVERLHTFVVPTSGVPFVVCVGDQPIYHGAFWTLVSSQSSDGVIIETLAAEMHGSVRIELGYPGPDFFQGPDPRPDPRILQALERAGKLK